MRVGLISHEGGGISSVTSGLAESLARKKVPTTIFTGTTARTQDTEKLSEYSQVVRFPMVDFPPRSVWFQIMNLNKLLDELRKCTVVHGVSPDASFLLTYLKKKLKKPFVATIHGSARSFQREFFHSPLPCWTLGDVANHIFKVPLND
jgi:glycosyltransferase involved in cell wall biosynthesis